MEKEKIQNLRQELLKEQMICKRLQYQYQTSRDEAYHNDNQNDYNYYLALSFSNERHLDFLEYLLKITLE